MFRFAHIVATVFILLCHGPLNAQTANNNMAQAERLELDQFIHSKTHGNTVEYNCIDESLTGKCIKYHNDQWYSFRSDDSNKLYINISGQKCRDLLGVQLVVIEGELCSPWTYTILDCISLATQDDIFIEIDNIKPNHNYWLNVDGYLHDFCSFFLEVSHAPKGFSAKQEVLLENSSTQANGNHFSMVWSLPDSLSHLMLNTKILKRAQYKFTFDPIATIPVAFNAYGNMQTRYEYTDTVYTRGTFYYRLVTGLNNGLNYFVDEFIFTVGDKDLKSITLVLDYERNSSLELQVLANSQVMEKKEFSFNPARHSFYKLYIDKYLNKGIEQLEIRIFNKTSQHTKTYYANLKNGMVKGTLND